MGSHPNGARYDNHHQHPRGTSNYNNTHNRPQSGSQSSYTGSDPFSNPFVQRATGHRRAGTGATSQSNDLPPNFQQDGFQSAGSTPWPSSSGEPRHTPAADSRPTQDEAAAESGVIRALGASGLVGVIMLVAAVVGNSKRTS